MKVLLVAESLRLSSCGGAELSCKELAVELIRQGQQVEILAMKVDGGVTSDAPVRPYPRGLGGKVLHVLAKGHEYGHFCNWVSATAKELQPDIVHAVCPVPIATVYQPRSGTIKGTVLRSNCMRQFAGRRKRRMNAKQRAAHRIERLLAANAQCMFVPHSDYVRAQCQMSFKVPDGRIRMIYQGIDLAPFAMATAPASIRRVRTSLGVDGQAVALFSAHDLRLKGINLLHHHLLEASRQMPMLSRKLLVVVCSKTRYCPPPPLRAMLKWAGHIRDRSAMAAMFGASDFILHPTWHDPCSRTVLEAIASNRPMMASAFDGAAEVVRRHRCGVVISNLEDTSKFLSALRLLLDPSQRTALAARSSKAVSEISITRHVKELIDLYASCPRPRLPQ